MRAHRTLSTLVSAPIVASLLLSCGLFSALPEPSSTSAISIPKEFTPEELARVEQDALEGLVALIVDDLGPTGTTLVSQHTSHRLLVLEEMYAAIEADLAVTGRRGLARAAPSPRRQLTTGRAIFEIYLMMANAATAGGDGTAHVRESSMDGTGHVDMTITKSGSTLEVDIDVRVTTDAEGGGTMTETLHGRVVVQSCPDANGRAPLDFSFEWTFAGSGGSQAGTVQMTGSGRMDGIVNDDAALAEIEFDLTAGVTRHGPVSGALGQAGDFAEFRNQFTFTIGGPTPALKPGSKLDVTRQSEGADVRMVSRNTDALLLAASTAVQVLKMAETRWQTGYCLEVIVTGVQDANKVEESSTSTFTGTVRHKFEGTELKGPLTAELSGDQSVKPTAKTDAPVDYTYVAGEKPDATATVLLETRSRRGAAKKSITFTTGSTNWRPISDVAPWSGQVCALDKPFTLKLSGIIPETFTFQPESESQGSFTMTMAVQNCEVRGSGTYGIEITVPQDPTETEADITLNVTDQTMYCPDFTPTIPPTVLHILLEPYSDPSCK